MTISTRSIPTCQSNDSEGSFGNPSEHSSESESESISVPNEMSTSKSVTTNEKVVSESKEVEPSPKLLLLRAQVNNWYGENANVNTVRANVNSVRQNVNSVRTNINTVRSKQPVPTNNTNSFSPVRPQVNKFNQRSHFSKSHSPVRRPIVRNTARMTYSHAVKGNWSTAVKTSAGYNWRGTRPNSNYNSGSNFVRTVNVKGPQGRPKPEKAWSIFDSGFHKGNMTGNKDHLDEFEECKGGVCTLESTSPEVVNHPSGNPTPISEPETKSSSSSPTLISLEERNSNPSSFLPHFHNSLSSSTTSSSPSLHISVTCDYFLEEFADELAPSESFPPGNDDMTTEDVIKEVKCLLTQSPLANYSLDNDLINTILEMFTDEYALDYSSPANMDDYGRMTFFMKHETDI
ncbi:hypothetical protein Tco_0729288 [Tanacetum coccineum]|uniref:Uncharacterized protein n=1 Tax=Tanacetum coccineum TaxID=301880 RepID=A0ABQ4YR67_9ASTR